MSGSGQSRRRTFVCFQSEAAMGARGHDAVCHFQTMEGPHAGDGLALELRHTAVQHHEASLCEECAKRQA
jgi:hypothetical protein